MSKHCFLLYRVQVPVALLTTGASMCEGVAGQKIIAHCDAVECVTSKQKFSQVLKDKYAVAQMGRARTSSANQDWPAPRECPEI